MEMEQDLLLDLLEPRDLLPARGGWAPGATPQWWLSCRTDRVFAGAAEAWQCADCAYANIDLEEICRDVDRFRQGIP